MQSAIGESRWQFLYTEISQIGGRKMEYVTLGKTGLKVSKMGLGEFLFRELMRKEQESLSVRWQKRE